MSFKQYFIGKKSVSVSNAIKQIDFPPKAKFIRMQQIHKDSIAQITKDDLKKNITEIKNVDACFTSLKNTFLSIKTADCLPITIAGSNKDSTLFVAAAHAGRKSTQEKILFKILEKLNQTYDFEHLATLNIWFGPAICFDCYQIDKKTNLHFNLIEENKKQLNNFLKETKINKKVVNLEITQECTLHQNEKYYSYRATGKGVKMNYSFIGIT